uniref:Uncharacterized protein n=1 Tax=Branchiostoma floridae TaxID=7739 RepID=C3XVL8_BRAFL|eukprot:XP_002611802.1 hypothetical protein BRAFLDRAFT_103025 [Branchiostoma floridae]
MYETGSIPSENDADKSDPVKDSTKIPVIRHPPNTYEKLANPRNYDSSDGHPSIPIGCNDHRDGNQILDDIKASVDAGQPIKSASGDVDVNQHTDESICQNDKLASKLNINPTSQQHSYETLTKPSDCDNDGHPSIPIVCNEHDGGNHMPGTTEAVVDAGQPITPASADDNICQNDKVASKLNINPTSQHIHMRH